jgi:hypothetical protein
MSAEGFPLPRLWLVESRGSVLIQLQVNRFDLNWRWLGPNDTYPSFDVQLAKLMDYWRRFADFLNEHSDAAILVRGAEVLKVSHMRDGEGWNHWSDIEGLFPSLALTQIGDHWDFPSFATSLEMNHEAGKVRAELKFASLTVEPNRKALVLELRSEASNIQASTRDIGNLAERLTVANGLAMRVLTIFDGLIFTLFEVRFPFRFPHAVGEDGKRNWEADIRCRAGRCVEHREVRAGWRADSPRDRVRSDPRRSMR